MTQTVNAKLEEKRKSRKVARKARRTTLKEKILKDGEFKKAYFAAKSTRSQAKTTAFKKSKSGKK